MRLSSEHRSQETANNRNLKLCTMIRYLHGMVPIILNIWIKEYTHGNRFPLCPFLQGQLEGQKSNLGKPLNISLTIQAKALDIQESRAKKFIGGIAFSLWPFLQGKLYPQRSNWSLLLFRLELWNVLWTYRKVGSSKPLVIIVFPNDISFTVSLTVKGHT